MHVVAETRTVVGREAVVRTSMGDIRARLFPDECPKVRPMPGHLYFCDNHFLGDKLLGFSVGYAFVSVHTSDTLIFRSFGSSAS